MIATIEDKRTRLAALETALAEAGGRGVELAEEIDRLRLEIGRETGEGPFGCRTCGATEIRAWYQVDEAQGVEILSYDGDSLTIDSHGWPVCHIDWTAAAEALLMDYTSVEFGGYTYYTRS